MKPSIVRILVFVVFALASVAGQAEESISGPPAGHPSRPGGPMQGGPMQGGMDFADTLIRPDVLQRHQDELQLTDKQREQVMNEVQATQKRIMEIQWAKKSSDELKRVLEGTKIDEKEAARLFDQMSEGEVSLKKARFMMLVKIKNVLTKEQQAKAQTLQGERGEGMRPGMGKGMGRGFGRGPQR